MLPYSFSKTGNTNLWLQELYYPNSDFAIGISNYSILRKSSEKVLLAPKFNHIYNSLYHSIYSVTFSWTEIEGALRYRIKIMNDEYPLSVGKDDFENPWIDIVLENNTMTLRNLKYKHGYVAWIKAIGNNIESNWSNSEHLFNTIPYENYYLIPTDILYPPSLAMNIPLEIKVRWLKVPNATHYMIYLWDLEDNLIYFNNEIQDTTVTISGLEPRKAYRLGHKTAFGDERTRFEYLFFFTADFTPVLDLEQYKTDVLKIFPNPVKEFCTIYLKLVTNCKANIEVYNLIGVKQLEFDKYLNAGDNFLPLELYDLPYGKYFVKITTNNKTYTGSLLKNRVYKMKIIKIISIFFFLLTFNKPIFCRDIIENSIADSSKFQLIDIQIVQDSLNNNESIQEASFTYKYLIRIFPIPVIHQARIIIYGIQNTEGKEIQLKIYDLYGKLVKDISYEVNRASGNNNK